MFEMCDLPPPAPSCGCQPCAGPRAAVTADPLLMSTVLSGFWKRLTLQPKLFPEKRQFEKSADLLRGRAVLGEPPAGLPVWPARGAAVPGDGDFLPRPPGGAGPAREDRPVSARRLCTPGPQPGRRASPRTPGCFSRACGFSFVFKPVSRSSSFAEITGTVRFVLCTFEFAY